MDLFLFFFFQAEDGIRDDLVTGVQTCALPISAVLKFNYTSLEFYKSSQELKIPKAEIYNHSS